MQNLKISAITIALLMMIPVSNVFAGGACKKDYKAAKKECKKLGAKDERKICEEKAKKAYRKCKKESSSGGYGGGY